MPVADAARVILQRALGAAAEHLQGLGREGEAGQGAGQYPTALHLRALQQGLQPALVGLDAVELALGQQAG